MRKRSPGTRKGIAKRASEVRRFFFLLCGLAAPISAVAELQVALTDPPAGVPLFGNIEMVVETYPAEGASMVEFFVDGELVGTLEAPPYRLKVDVGEENKPHRLKVRAHDVSGGVAEAAFESPAILINERVDATLQQLYVTVLNNEQRILGLQEAEFEIFDNRSPQRIVTFSRGEVPLASIILVDASASMKGRRLRFALGAAGAFAQGIEAEDEVSIQVFAGRLLFASPFSSEISLLTAGLAKVRAQGGTALNDSLYRSLKLLEARQGRRVVVILSDGIDSHSVIRMPQVSWLARRSRAMIYWIRVDPMEARKSRHSAWKRPDDYRREYRMLEGTVNETGGRIVTLERIEESETAVREILAELREQYVLGYYPTTRRSDGSWHKVSVRLRLAGLQVRARGGYIDY